jgi:hypothetical protein
MAENSPRCAGFKIIMARIARPALLLEQMNIYSNWPWKIIYQFRVWNLNKHSWSVIDKRGLTKTVNNCLNLILQL